MCDNFFTKLATKLNARSNHDFTTNFLDYVSDQKAWPEQKKKMYHDNILKFMDDPKYDDPLGCF